MFRFKNMISIFILGFCFSFAANALEASVSYHSWIEKMELDSSTASDNTWASMNGTGIHIKDTEYFGKLGVQTKIGAIFGNGSAGSTSNSFGYVAEKTTYYGLQGSLQLQQKISSQIRFGAGPFILYRMIKWNIPTGVQVVSGTDLNLGGVFSMAFNLTPDFEFFQELGALAFKATTFWQLGFGYNF